MQTPCGFLPLTAPQGVTDCRTTGNDKKEVKKQAHRSPKSQSSMSIIEKPLFNAKSASRKTVHQRQTKTGNKRCESLPKSIRFVAGLGSGIHSASTDDLPRPGEQAHSTSSNRSPKVFSPE